MVRATCGTTSPTFAPDGIELTLVDLSAGMVGEAVGRTTATGRFAAVDGRVADARALLFADETFDLVVSTYALYYVPEPDRAVAELALWCAAPGSWR